ncbi:hypothetical protein LTR37_002639 [Vermiconidia calcicola]|uniref:Uncharacterized protein n=1 Tax=Vermiconidia calcicola TaxID=1690605 RepID=A0ACC3NV34_9PEZI|nr:hypothetical protein LTR37_002639 [Vermiconidia calcicola]
MAEVNRSPGSEAPTSHSSDFYSLESPPRQTGFPAPVEPPVMDHAGTDTTASHQDQPQEDAHSDSSSEMDMSDSSRSSSPEPEPEPPSHTGITRSTGAKRKLSDGHDVTNGELQTSEDQSKKRKLQQDRSQAANGDTPRDSRLSVELWQQVFLYLPPAMLGRCLRVSKTFNRILTKTKAAPVAKKPAPKVRVLESEAIWTQARKNFLDKLPRPLARFTELQMLQLIGNHLCQFCHTAPVHIHATSPINCGPGPGGVRVIWPFGIRACGPCLSDQSLKDLEVMSWEDVRHLRPGLPSILLTEENHYISETQRQIAAQTMPKALKEYYHRDLQILAEEANDAEDFGEGAAAEWKKGLPTRGKEAMSDASRWEKWEAQLPFGSDLSRVLREYDPVDFSRRPEQSQSSPGTRSLTQPATAANGQNVLPQPVFAVQNGYSIPHQLPSAQYQQAHRPVRDAHEVDRLRQARRAEIERRCLQLMPPIQPTVLQHMSAFRNAMQITRQLTDPEWAWLQPRLEEQREAAELAEHQRLEHYAALQATMPVPVQQEPYTKPAKDVYDQEYDRVQEPLRKKLGEYADEHIQLEWNGARDLDKDNSPTFAVSTMNWVHRRYLQDMQAGIVPNSGHPAKASSKKGTPVPEPFLSLDNMKWVYDNKIRPLTDKHRRELFICSGCPEERKPKWFAFEGLIQHFGAKHTILFSKGNIVVHWQNSAWPAEPPFHESPDRWVSKHRASGSRGNGGARKTPQVSHDGPFATPGSNKLLSESPFFSNQTQMSPQTSYAHYGQYNGASGYAPHQYGQATPQAAAYDYPYHQHSAPQGSNIEATRTAQLNKLSSDAHEIWDKLEGVKQLLDCVRVQTVVHHMATRFQEQFGHMPALDDVTDALASSPLMRAIKNASHLACKLCVAAQTDGAADRRSYFGRTRNVKQFNLSSLITHFKITHQADALDDNLNWAKDMIELPETELISDLIRAPGMDDEKLAVAAAAFPHAFTWPLPAIGFVTEPPPDVGPNVGPDSGLASRMVGKTMKKMHNQSEKKKRRGRTSATPGREDSEPLPEPKEHEYDPRKPMFLQGSKQEADPARFDTDIARKSSASTSPQNGGNFAVPPELFAALNNSNAFAAQYRGPAEDDRAERSPSVGRAEPAAFTPMPSASSSNVAPNISAILAQLTGQPQAPQTATPPMTLSARSGSAPRNAQADPYVQPRRISPITYHEERPTSSRYAPQPAYGASAEPTTRFEGQGYPAAVSYNTRNFERNRVQSYTEAPYAPPQHSPPRYRSVYENSQSYAQAPHHEAPVRYIEIPPEQGHLRPTYPYERAAPKPVYVDEYGRPVRLIPIDDGIAPVQFLPHPYEQQQHARAPLQQQQQMLPAYEERRSLYYEPVGTTQAVPAYAYDDGARSSVPRA